MKKYLVGLMALFALLVVTPAHAASFTGNELMGLCKDTGPGEPLANATKYTECIEFLAALYDEQATVVELSKSKTRLICRPRGVDTEQQRQVFLKWMDANPADWVYSAVYLGLFAFKEAWPCPR